MKVSIRAEVDFIFDDSNVIKKIKEIELAFHFRDIFFDIDVDALISRVKKLGLNVNSIHGPALRLYKEKEFLSGIEKCGVICSELSCRYIVIHPSPVNLRYDTIDFLKNSVTPFLEEQNLVIAWENFPGKKRIVNSVDEIAYFITKELEDTENYGICFDTSHAKKKTSQLIRLLQKYKDLIRVYHISNWSSKQQHLPVFDASGNIDFYKVLSKSNFNPVSAITLEYFYTYTDKLLEDFPLVVKRLLGD